MTYEQLVVLNAIVTEGTFRAAADRLSKSQSAVSHMLKKLENEVDIVLLSRETYRPKLTPAGEAFYRQATRVLQQMQQLHGTAKSLSTNQEAELLLVASATCPLQPLLGIVGEIAKNYPETHIRFSTESMGGPIERLLRDDADIIIATLDGVPSDQVEAVPYTKVSILPVAHPDFEPAQSSRLKTTTEMQSFVQVIVAGSSSDSFSQTRDLLPGGHRWTVSDFSAKKEIILAKMGWGGIPEHLIKDELDRGELTILNVEGFPPRQSHVYQIRRRDRDTGIVGQIIWERLISR